MKKRDVLTRWGEMQADEVVAVQGRNTRDVLNLLQDRNRPISKHLVISHWKLW